MLPKISVITICYNAERWIESTILSVINQTYSNIEYIIVDGGSTDGTMAIVHKFSSPKFTILSEPDKGIYDAMNKGLAMATGDYVWFINAGDEIYESTTLENLIPYFQENADIIYGDTMLMNESHNIVGLRRKRPPEKFTWKSFRMGMTVCHQSILVSRKIAPNYDLQYKICADIDWIIRIMKQAEIICNSHRILSRFLVGGISQQREKKVWKERFTIMQRHYGLSQTLVFHFFILLRYIFKLATAE